MVSVQTGNNPRPWLAGTGLAVGLIASAQLTLHLYAGRHDGYFVDELYYLACARHLDWGYVDQPPLIAVITRIIQAAWGDSLAALRFLPALEAAATTLLTGLIAREMGGGRFAQGLAALCLMLAPAVLAVDHILSMNAFEHLFWIGSAYLILRIIRTGNGKLWLWFVLVTGLGLKNKHSMLIFGFGLVAGLVLTPERRWLRSPWFWARGGLAFLVFCPILRGTSKIIFPSWNCRPTSGGAGGM